MPSRRIPRKAEKLARAISTRQRKNRGRGLKLVYQVCQALGIEVR